MGTKITVNGAEKVYEAASTWVKRALRSDDSLFTPGRPIWSSQWLAELHERFLNDSDKSGTGTAEKFLRQLAGSPPEVYQLVGEVLYFHFLVVTTKNSTGKQSRINDVLEMSAAPVQIPENLVASLKPGLVNPGQNFHSNRHFQLGFLIEFVEQWKERGEDEQIRLLASPWEFKDFAKGFHFRSVLLRDSPNRPNTQREALLHLVFPDTFDAIVSIRHKVKIAETFADFVIKQSDDVDRQLAQIRPVLETRYGSRDWLFYRPPVKDCWENGIPLPPVENPPVPPSYSIDDIVRDGCFVERPQLESMLERLKSKKNLILQGPPGTGKTWLAKKLAFVLVGSRSESRVRPFQFHPNLSYEDFVRGWRPSGDERLELVDGPLLKAIGDAKGDPSNDYVVVIEEINRGNPAQIFGEMLTLLEADKRTPEEALGLSYPRTPSERVHIPPNLHIIGTMNLADRSLALVDFALRRRFAFINLEPTFGDGWRSWVSEQCQIDVAFLSEIEGRLNSLNQAIAEDITLGPQFRVGHSVVTPAPGTPIGNSREWFKQVVETEIGPLLDEYWFDDPDRSSSERKKLLQGLVS